jgi:murein tripeptide amidase MpaA
LTTKYGTDAEITALLDYADWLITPVSNPDGYEYTWTTVYNA